MSINMDHPDFENLCANYAVVERQLSDGDNKYFLPGSFIARPAYFIDYSKVEIKRRPNNDSTVKIPVFRYPLLHKGTLDDDFLAFILFFDFEGERLTNFYVRTWEIEPCILTDIPTTHYFKMTDDHCDDNSKKCYLPDCLDFYYIDYGNVKFSGSHESIIIPIYGPPEPLYISSERDVKKQNCLEYIIKINFDPRNNGVASFTLKSCRNMSNYSFKTHVTDNGMDFFFVKRDFRDMVRSITGRPENTVQEKMEIGREVLILCRQLEKRIKDAENVVQNYFNRILNKEIKEDSVVPFEDYELCKMVKNILFFHSPKKLFNDDNTCKIQ